MAAQTSSANPESLAVLSEMVNQTLIDTGRFFRTSGSIQSRTQLKTSLPAAYDKFQVALDNLSEQIFIAKAFLENDYEAMTAKKVAPTPKPVTAPLPSLPVEDVTMAEAPATTEDEPRETVEVKSEIPNETEKLESIPPPPPGEEKGPDAQNAPENQSVDIETEDAPTTLGDPGLPVTSGEELTFDSMLASVGEDGTNDFDLNLNFTNDDDDVGNQNFLAGTNFLDSGGGTSTDPAGASISSLLPGLESYAADPNSNGGDFNLELQNLGDGTHVPQDDIMGPGESSFDDLFMEKDQLDGDENLLGGDGLMDLGELDDSWFN